MQLPLGAAAIHAMVGGLTWACLQSHAIVDAVAKSTQQGYRVGSSPLHEALQQCWVVDGRLQQQPPAAGASSDSVLEI